MFKDKKERIMPEVSTASLPDIIFMLLFFFMVVTVMRSTELAIPLVLPETMDNEKIKKIDREVNIQVGEASDKVVVDGVLVSLDKLVDYLELVAHDIERTNRLSIPIYLRVDRHSKMSKVSAVKLALRKTGLRKLNYIVLDKNVNPWE